MQADGSDLLALHPPVETFRWVELGVKQKCGGWQHKLLSPLDYAIWSRACQFTQYRRSHHPDGMV